MQKRAPLLVPRKFSVLVLESSPLVLNRYREQVGEEHHVDYVVEARSAIHKFKNHRYDLVVTDLSLPDKSAESFIFDLQQIDPNQKIAVVAVASEILHFISFRGVYLFEKPINLREVIAQVLVHRKDSASSRLPHRRRHPRCPVELDVRVLLPFGGEARVLPVRNLSLGGVFIEGSELVKIPSEVINIDLALMGESLRLEAQRCWSNEKGVGYRFLDVDSKNFSKIENYLGKALRDL